MVKILEQKAGFHLNIKFCCLFLVEVTPKGPPPKGAPPKSPPVGLAGPPKGPPKGPPAQVEGPPNAKGPPKDPPKGPPKGPPANNEIAPKGPIAAVASGAPSKANINHFDLLILNVFLIFMNICFF